MLDHIAEDGTFRWTCPHCNVQQTAHISHEQLRYSEMDPTHVILPKCACGSQTGVNVVFSEQDLTPPIIHQGVHPITCKEDSILGVEVVGAPNFTHIKSHVERHVVNGEDVFVRIIDEVYEHPALVHHQELHRQLQVIGKAPPTS